MRHLAGVGGKEISHRFTGVACQRVTLFLADAIVSHLQVIYAAGFLKVGKRGQKVLGLVGIFHPHRTRHLDELSVAGVAFHEEHACFNIVFRQNAEYFLHIPIILFTFAEPIGSYINVRLKGKRVKVPYSPAAVSRHFQG